jgi:hypothetical protein
LHDIAKDTLKSYTLTIRDILNELIEEENEEQQQAEPEQETTGDILEDEVIDDMFE